MLFFLGGDIIRKVTYTKSANGLSAEFSSESPTMHLDLKQFDGAGVSASAVTYKPVELGRQKTISTALSARSVTLPVQLDLQRG